MNRILTQDSTRIITKSVIHLVPGGIINNAVVIIPMAIIFMYSAIKINANVPDLYSVLNPDTNSDSPSARSNGVRLVSAREVMIQVTRRGQVISMKAHDVSFAKELRLKVDSIIMGVKMTKAILTSYEMVWAILRSAPRREYLLFEAQPENSVVYTFILDNDRNNIMPHFIWKGVLL
jgi:hypothetical protein